MLIRVFMTLLVTHNLRHPVLASLYATSIEPCHITLNFETEQE